MEAHTPAEITEKAGEIGYKKANASVLTTVIGSVLAGMYIAFGGFFSITSISGLAGIVPFGIIKIIAGLAFSLGLILVMIAGAELFTGNVLLIIALLQKKITIGAWFKNLGIVYLANFIGALTIVGLLYIGGWHTFGDGIIAKTLYNIGIHKIGYTFFQALSLGILCNILVCLGVWLAYSGKSTTDKIIGIIFPITAFVAGGFEHSIANMFYLPFTYLLQTAGLAGENATTIITVQNMITKNFIPVTIGNIIGGAIFVGFLYRALYRKK